MQSPLFKPSAIFSEQVEAAPIAVQITGAQSITKQATKQHARFAGDNQEEAASILIDHPPQNFSANVECIFESSSKRMLFIRAERFKQAELTLNICVEKNATTHVVLLLKNAHDATAKFDIKATVAEKADFTLTMFHLNEGRTIGDISVINQVNAHSNVSLFDVDRGTSKADFRLENICAAPYAAGQLTTRCMLYDKATSRIQGVPVITTGSHDADNHLDQMSILFSPQARSESVPLLSVANNAVRASHRSAIARLSDDDVFYFNTRGITKSEAEKLYLSGFLSEVARPIPVKEIANCCTEAVHHFLENAS